MPSLQHPTFGKYEILDRLAIGGMAELFRARFKGAAGFAKDVVIKRIHHEMSDSPEFVRMFTNEAKIAALLNHPNIVQVTDFDCVEDVYYLAMEFVHGVDLRRLLRRAEQRRKPLPARLALYIASQILRGLHYAHSFARDGKPQQIVHRDISPHNVMVSFQGEVKVTDFGIARIVQHVSVTATGVIKGKLAYMAPEQSESSKVDHRADLFSVGVILWEMLCRQRLFAGENELMMLENLRELKVPPPHTLDATIPQDLSALVCSSLQRDVDKRPKDARSFLRELQRFSVDSLEVEEELRLYLKELFVEEAKKPSRGTASLKSWQPPPPKHNSQDLPFARTHTAFPDAGSEEGTETDPEGLRLTAVSLTPSASSVEEQAPDLLTMDIRSPRLTEPTREHRSTFSGPPTAQEDEFATVEVNPRHYLSAAQFLKQESSHEVQRSPSGEQLSTTEFSPAEYLSAQQLKRVPEPLPLTDLSGIAKIALPPEAASPAMTKPLVQGVSLEELETREGTSPYPLPSISAIAAASSSSSSNDEGGLHVGWMIALFFTGLLLVAALLFLTSR